MKENTLVAIIGRPNVGKSSLFNRLIGTRKAIVEKTSGITRDRVYGRVTWGNTAFELVDTGGLDLGSEKKLPKEIIKQARQAMEEAAQILFVVDFQEGLTALDREVADLLRKLNKPVVLVVNKTDNMAETSKGSDFFELGLERVLFISAMHGLNINELLELIVVGLKSEKSEDLPPDLDLKVAIVGRPNVGKSSFLNKLLQEDRVIVDDVPGTTRDSIDTHLNFNSQGFTLIDTAGIGQKKKMSESIDIFSRSRTVSAVQRADVCLVLLDAKLGITRDDLHVFDLIIEQRKCCVIAVNKSDLGNFTLPEYTAVIKQRAPLFSYAFTLLCSAKTGKNIYMSLTLCRAAWENTCRKIKQEDLNKCFNRLKAANTQLLCQGKLKFHYLTQASIKPPKFVIIVNKPALVKNQFMRYIENQIRKDFNFQGTAINLVLKAKKRD